MKRLTPISIGISMVVIGHALHSWELGLGLCLLVWGFYLWVERGS